MALYDYLNKDQAKDLCANLVSDCVKKMSIDMIYKSTRYKVQKNAAVHGIRGDNHWSLHLARVAV